MSPKTATIISLIAFLSLTLTVTLSLAQTQCQRFRTVGEALQNYELPAGLFPNNVQSFSCNPVSVPGITDALSLVVRLQGACRVTREALGVRNVLQCQQQFSAIISRRLLTNVRGVTITLIASSPPFGPLNLALIVDQVKVVQPVTSKFVQFYDTTGIASPSFPTALIPSQPPSCDPSAAFDYSYNDNAAAGDVVAQAEDNQDIPNWVSNNYGSLLPLVVA